MANKVGPADPEAMGRPDAKNQFLAVAVVSGVATLTIGNVLGFSAILLPQLETEEDLSPEDKSWIASLSNIGQLGGSVVIGVLSGKIGRKYTIMVLCLPLIAGWTIIGLSQGSVTWICVGRILQGVGVMSSVSQVYLVEIADTEHRGMFGASGAMSVSAGITLIYCLGAVLHWKLVCLVCGIIPVLVILLMLPLPETPSWLILNQRKEEAEISLTWLRGNNYDISAEMDSLLAAQGNSGNNNGIIEILKTFRYPGAYKPFIILMTVFALQQLSGSFAVIFYAVTLFKDIGVSTNPYIPAILTGLIRLLGTVIGTYLLKYFGRKTLMIVSAVLMAVFMSTLALTVHVKEVYLKDNCTTNLTSVAGSNFSVCSSDLDLDLDEKKAGVVRSVLQIYPAVAVVLYMLSFGVGVGTVPWLLLGELCPSKVKGVASGITVSVAFISIFVVVKSFPFCMLYLKPAGTYGLFAAVSLCLGVYTWLCVPETRGKTLAEIQTLYGNID